MPTRSGSRAAETVHPERTQPQFQLLTQIVSADDESGSRTVSEHHAALRDALTAENLDEAFIQGMRPAVSAIVSASVYRGAQNL